ncbi:MAG: hypothetical protein QOI07_912 [Verrucomicrobiota bacterium]|jgi:hypothetical protein
MAGKKYLAIDTKSGKTADPVDFSDVAVILGAPTAATPDNSNNGQRVATTAFVHNLVTALINSSPSTLDSLKELADAIGDDPNFAVTIAASIAAKAALAGNNTFTGQNNFNALLSSGLSVSQIGNPGAPTVTPIGNDEGATWSYKIVAKLSDGTASAAGPAGTTTHGESTLDATNKNSLTWAAVPRAVSYDIYRVAHGVSPSTNGKIANVTGTSYVDTGAVGDGATPPIANATGSVDFHSVSGGLKSVLDRVDVAVFATGGDGTSGNPWTGWETIVTKASNTCYYFRRGYFSAASWIFDSQPGAVLSNIQVRGESGTVLRFTGSSGAGGVGGYIPAGVGLCFAGNTDDPTIRPRRIFVSDIEIDGMGTAVTGLHYLNVHQADTKNLRIHDVTTHGMRLTWAILGQHDAFACTPDFDTQHGVRPQYAITLDASAWGYTTTQRFTATRIDGTTVAGINGVYCADCKFDTGSVEYSSGIGFLGSAICNNMVFLAMDFEGNDGGDVVISGNRNTFIAGSYLSGFHQLAGANTFIISGAYASITFDAGVLSPTYLNPYCANITDNSQGTYSQGAGNLVLRTKNPNSGIDVTNTGLFSAGALLRLIAKSGAYGGLTVGETDDDTLGFSNVIHGDAIVKAGAGKSLHLGPGDGSGPSALRLAATIVIDPARLPTTDPMSLGQLWLSGGVLQVSSVSGMARTPYTPDVVASDGSGFAATATGRKKQVGKTMFINVEIVITDMGSGVSGYTFSLPLASKSGRRTGFFAKDIGYGKLGGAVVDSGAAIALVKDVNNAFLGQTGSTIVIEGSYEVD